MTDPKTPTPELLGDASPDAHAAFDAVVRQRVAQWRTQTQDIATLVQDHFGACVVQSSVSHDVRMPYLTLLHGDVAKPVEDVVSRALGDAELNRIEQWAHNELMRRERPQDGYIGVGATHVYRFVPADMLPFWEAA